MNENVYTALVILNYNNAVSTLNCIESVMKYNSAKIKFYVIDNGSKPEDYASLKEGLCRTFSALQLIADVEPMPTSFSDAVLIRSEQNLGYACGNNFGLKYVYADPDISYILILNNDILFVEDIVPLFIAASERIHDFAVLTPVLYKRDGRTIDRNCARRQVKLKDIISQNFLHYWWKLRNQSAIDMFKDRFITIHVDNATAEQEIEVPSGSCMFMRKDFFQGIGGFDPNTFLYYEENILYEIIKKEGKRNFILPNAHCIHLGGDSISQLPNQLKVIKICSQSKDYFVSTYLDVNPLERLIYKISGWFFICCVTLQKKLKMKK